jgi:outer membrane biosynthesis protein TonB
MSRRGMRTVILLLVCAAAGVCLLAEPVKWPRYTRDQLNDKSFVQAETQKYQAMREDLEGRIKAVNEMTQVPLKTDLGIVTAVLAALDYVNAHGYDPQDPELAKLEYFQRQQYPPMPVKPRPTKKVEETVYKFDDPAIIPPTPKANPPVDVPPELVGEGLNAVFKCEFVIDSQGVPKDLKVITGVNKDIDALATQTILEKWRFDPGTKDGKPVSVRYNLAIPFKLQPPAKEPAAAEEKKS